MTRARSVTTDARASQSLVAEADARITRAQSGFWPRVDVAETYDAGAQVTRGTWHLSTDAEPDFVVLPLEIRSIFPQELPLLVSLGGLRLVDRFGDLSGRPFAGDVQLQLCICESGD